MNFNDAELFAEIMGKIARARERKSLDESPQTAPPAPLTDESNTSSEPTKEKKKRCGCCKKKLGLITFPCKCGGEFCSLHRSSEDHTCSFDYHADAKKALSTMLVKVEAKKIDVL